MTDETSNIKTCERSSSGWTCSAPSPLRQHVWDWCSHCQDQLRSGFILRGPDHVELERELASIVGDDDEVST
jgi:hypothetical protein